MDSIINRLKEPSTYAGIAALAGFAGLRVTPEAWQGVVSIISLLGGFAAIVIPEAAKR